MNDRLTEISTRSWFSRIGGAFKGILFGLLLAVLAVPLLWWNEGRAVDRARTLDAGARAVVSIDAARLDPANEGRLVHLSGLATTAETLADPVFGLSAPAIKLRRTVEMYQWDEESQSTTRTQLGGGETTETTYSYRTRWSERWIDSSRFKQPEGHRNPGAMPYASTTWQARRVDLGAFQLGTVFIERLGPFNALAVDPAVSPPEGFVAHDGGFYRGTPMDPQIGDLRVAFAAVEPLTVSVVGRQSGPLIERAPMPKGSIALLGTGVVDADTLFASAHADNRLLTWLLRGGGLFALFIGFGMVLAPLKVIADVLPLAGRIVGAGTGLIAGVLALAIGSIVIAAAWVFYRPLVGGLLLLAALGALAAGAAKLARAPAPPNPSLTKSR